MAVYLWIAFTCVALFVAQWSFEKVIEIEFTEFHDAWLAGGRPHGSGMSRKQALFWTSGQAKAGCWGTWLFQTPDWARTHELARKLMVRMRVAFAVAIVPPIALFGYLFYLDRH